MSRGVPSTLTDAEAASLDALHHQMFSDDAQNGKGTSGDEYSRIWFGEEGHVPTDSATDAAGDTDNAKATQTAEDFVEQWIESETSKDGAKKTGILNPPKPLSLNDTETRRWYLDAEAQIPKLIDRTKPLEQQAKQASAMRNQIRTQAREAMTNRELANTLFGSRPNMTWEEVVEKYSKLGLTGDELYEEIIRAATRSNPYVNEFLDTFPK